MRWVLLLLLGLNVLFLAMRLHAYGKPPAEAPAEVPSVAHVNRLLLLSELDAGELRPRSPTETGGDVTPSDKPSGDTEAEAGTCFSVGPVQSGEDVAPMAQWLTERGAELRLREDERRELALYWVHLPPFDRAETAEAQVVEMKARGIDDIFVISRGDMARAISLGVYSRKTSLDRRIAELEAKGYRPEVTVRYRQKKATWYDARFVGGYEFPTERFTAVFPGAQVHEVPCGTLMVKLKASGLPVLPRS